MQAQSIATEARRVIAACLRTSARSLLHRMQRPAGLACFRTPVKEGATDERFVAGRNAFASDSSGSRRDRFLRRGVGRRCANEIAGGAAAAAADDAKPIPPSRSELVDSAFKKLDSAHKGYVTRDDTKELEGFDAVFQQNDGNHDGKLMPDEFKRAWNTYSVKP